ncbi:MAG: ketoacyl-ACP synthase III [Deltaproteobacteria bacterium]|nr:ketoacyl-ACP synthase III [Deltaproteobacteria bacterium]
MRWIGLSSAVPRRIVKSEIAVEHFPKADVDKVVGNIGVIEHREARPGTTSADLAIAAAGPLLERLGWPLDSIDALVFVTQTPDFYFPGSAHRIQNALGLSSKCLCLDVNLGCSGFTHGVIVMQALMGSGLIRRGLLLCGEVTTGTVRPGIADVRQAHELGNALMFGDAASAAAFERDGGEQIRATSWGSDGAGIELISVPGGGFKQFPNAALLEPRTDADGIARRPLDLRINGAAIFTFTIRRVPPLLDDTLARAGWGKEDVDAYVFHQANKFILEFLRKKMGIPAEKVPLSIEHFGNTSSASIPLTMLVRMGDRLEGKNKLVLLGFGSGLSWSGVAIETEGLVAVPLIEVE